MKRIIAGTVFLLLLAIAAWPGANDFAVNNLLLSGGTGFIVTVTGTPTANRTLTLQDSTGTAGLIIASGTSTMTSGTITAATCQTAVTTPATNTLITDTISWAYNAAPTLTTDALLHISPYVTSGNVNFTRCNPTAASITGTAIVINWRVVR